MLALLEQLSPYNSYNYHDIIGNTIAKYNLSNQIGWFIMDNAHNNNTCINFFIIKLRFNKEQHQVRCATYIFNLVA